MSFKQKSVVITGGTGALGRTVCTAFLELGAFVHATYISRAELDTLPPELKNNPNFKTSSVDLISEEAVCAWFQKLGPINVLANIAGGFAMGPLVETSLHSWQHMMDMNLTTCFLASREGLKVMDPNYGRIINVASYAATQKVGGMAAYTTSKASVMHLTEVLAEETLSRKITVNAILPTIMDTGGNRNAMPDADFSTWVPLENVAATVVFLAQESSWHITGACIPLRGHC